MLLELEGVSRRFGGLVAVSDLTLAVRPGTIHGLIGPNGAGKSTAFNLISGVLPVSAGRIRFKAREISGLSPAEVCRRGVARTFQTTTLFREYTVLENMLVASQLRTANDLGAVLFASRAYRRRGREALDRVRRLLGGLGLERATRQVAGQLPHRDQKALSLAMVLAADPELVMLDEPMAGLTVQETGQTMEFLRDLRRQGLTVLLVEHDMRAVMGLCDVVSVLDHGVKIAEGAPQEIQTNPAVIEAYLGAEDAHA